MTGIAFNSMFAQIELLGFALVFGIVVALAVRQQRHRARVQSNHPDEPWLWRKDWAEGQIASQSKHQVILQCVIAGIWNLATLPFTLLFLLRRDAPGTWMAVIILAVLWLVGLAILVAAVRSVIRWRKFGQSVFDLRSVPGVIGGQLAGIIKVPTRVCPQDGFRLRLACLRRITRRSGKHHHTSETVLWEQDQRQVQALPTDDPQRSVIPVEFDLPHGHPCSDDSNPRNKILWRLEAHAAVPGVDYSVEFEVPVFVVATPPEEPAPPLPPSGGPQ